jgi:hypothetical protein
LAPQGFPLLGWHHLIDATAANRKALWNQARRHLHPFPFPFLGSLRLPGTDFNNSTETAMEVNGNSLVTEEEANALFES